MSDLIKIISKNGKCLCKGCNLFERDTSTCCPIADNKENTELEGELFPSFTCTSGDTTWCKFKHCNMIVGEQNNIFNSPGYRVEGKVYGNTNYMWIPESIVMIKISEPKFKKNENRILPLDVKRYFKNR